MACVCSPREAAPPPLGLVLTPALARAGSARLTARFALGLTPGHRTPSRSVRLEPSKQAAPVWHTYGSPVELALEVEQALLSDRARLLLCDLLSCGGGGGGGGGASLAAAALDPPSVVSLLSLHFASWAEPAARTPATGPALCAAVRGWAAAKGPEDVWRLKVRRLAPSAPAGVDACMCARAYTHAQLPCGLQYTRAYTHTQWFVGSHI